jgi:hypothetical protein
MLRHVEPAIAVHVFLHHGVPDRERLARDDDLALGGSGFVGIKLNRATDAVGAAVDGFERRIQLEHGVIDALRIFEVEGLRGSGSDERDTTGDEEGNQAFFHGIN